jgi:hypothetical protein
MHLRQTNSAALLTVAVRLLLPERNCWDRGDWRTSRLLHLNDTPIVVVALPTTVVIVVVGECNQLGIARSDRCTKNADIRDDFSNDLSHSPEEQNGKPSGTSARVSGSTSDEDCALRA